MVITNAAASMWNAGTTLNFHACVSINHSLRTCFGLVIRICYFNLRGLCMYVVSIALAYRFDIDWSNYFRLLVCEKKHIRCSSASKEMASYYFSLVGANRPAQGCLKNQHSGNQS